MAVNGRRVGDDRANAGYFNMTSPIDGYREAAAYAHLGDLGLRGGAVSQNRDQATPEFYASAMYDNPALYGLPSYEGSYNTPLGQIGLQAGMLEDTPGIRGSYVPNDKAQAYAQALLSLLGR